MPQTQLIKERKERVELKRQRREQGLCIECGESEAIGNKSGNAILRCETCLKRYQADRKPKSEHVISRFVKPQKRTADEDDAWTYFESAEYAEYVEQVKDVVRYIDSYAEARFEHACINDIHTVLGHKRSNWTISALNAIDARPLHIIPERYTLKPPVVRSVPLSEGKPFPSSQRLYKTNERPSTLGLPQRATI